MEDDLTGSGAQIVERARRRLHGEPERGREVVDGAAGELPVPVGFAAGRRGDRHGGFVRRSYVVVDQIEVVRVRVMRMRRRVVRRVWRRVVRRVRHRDEVVALEVE